jgi:hypothetical protein
MPKRPIFTRTLIAALITMTSTAPAWAITMPGLEVQTRSDVLRVSDHHHNCHRRGHQAHGYDDTYSNDDANGMLFKSFVMGELTGSHKTTARHNVD